jgi:YegS/Rv2252/BmrU family lipid kinase
MDTPAAQRTSRRVAVIINPASGVRGGASAARTRARQAAAVLERHGCAAEILITTHGGHARELAQGAQRRGAEVVVAWGGDGTLNEVGSSLAFTGTPLGIIPSGSGNGLACELGIDRRPERALEDALVGDSRLIDVGEVSGQLFLNLAGVGFDAHIAREFASCRRRGLARYAWLTLAHLGRYRPQTYTIDADGERRTIKALLVCVANSRQFGSGALIAPDAVVDDGRLNLVVVGARPAWRTIGSLPALFRGRVARLRDVWSRPAEAIRISAGAPMLFHLDGEPVVGGEVLSFRVHPRALAVRVPGG